MTTMTLTLALIAVFSFGSMLIMAVLLWRVLREERRRSQARVTALTSEILREDQADKPVRSRVALFEAPDSAVRPAPRLAMALAIGVVVVGVAVSTVGLLSARRSASPTSAGARVSIVPLDLIALGHQRAGDTLTIKGVVRNPAGGAMLTRVTAVVFAFNSTGGFVTSSRAMVDDPVLSPGAESVFAISIAEPADIARYRISFRTDDLVVPHVDRRDRLPVSDAKLK